MHGIGLQDDTLKGTIMLIILKLSHLNSALILINQGTLHLSYVVLVVEFNSEGYDILIKVFH